MAYYPDEGSPSLPYQEAGTFGRPPSGPYQGRGYGQERPHDPYGDAAPWSAAPGCVSGDGTAGGSGLVPRRPPPSLAADAGDPGGNGDGGGASLQRRVPSPASTSPSQASQFPTPVGAPVGPPGAGVSLYVPSASGVPAPASSPLGGGGASSSHVHHAAADSTAGCRVIASAHSQYTHLAVSACTVLATEACLMMFREPPSEALLEAILKV